MSDDHPEEQQRVGEHQSQPGEPRLQEHLQASEGDHFASGEGRHSRVTRWSSGRTDSGRQPDFTQTDEPPRAAEAGSGSGSRRIRDSQVSPAAARRRPRLQRLGIGQALSPDVIASRRPLPIVTSFLSNAFRTTSRCPRSWRGPGEVDAHRARSGNGVRANTRWNRFKPSPSSCRIRAMCASKAGT